MCIGYRSATTVAILLAVVLLVSGCGGESGPEAGGRLVVGNNTDVVSLDPHMATDLYTVRVCDQIFDTLVRLDFDGNYAGSLAESWTVAEEGRVWEFTLREDVLFHDGEPLTAGDVEFSFSRIMDPEVESPRRSDLGGVEEIVIDPEDDRMVTVRLTEPNGAFLSTLLNIYIVPQHGVEELATEPFGSGPFSLEE